MRVFPSIPGPALAILAVLAWLVLAWAPGQGGAEARVESGVRGQAQPAGEYASAEELLRALETADRDLRAFEARIRYIKIFEIVGDTQTRDGTLYFRALPGAEGEPAERRFAVRFRKLLVGERLERINETYTFDGEWLVEKNHRERVFIKRRVVPPGAKFDPLRIGEGPMPIPIGQKADDVLERYDAKLVSVTEGIGGEDEAMRDLRAFVTGTTQIVLTPRARFAERDDFVEIRLWYAKQDGRLLPRASRTVNPAGDVAIVAIEPASIRINDEVEFPEGVFDVRTPERGWDVQVVEWRGRPAPGAGQDRSAEEDR